MENDEIVIAIALIFAVIVLITVKMIKFFVRFERDTRYITIRMRRACDYNEYRRWRGELCCHYLCLIPFVNKRNVMLLYRRIYHKPKDRSTEKRSDGLYHILAPSVISIFICAVCLGGTSWAWFTATQTSSVTNVQSATYTVSVTVKKDMDTSVTEKSDYFEISLDSGNQYEIILTADGTANNGYCEVNLDGEVYYTSQIKSDNTFTFMVKTYKEGVLKITPRWGTCSESDTITTLKLGTEQGSCSDESKDNTVAATPQVTPTTPTVDADMETTASVDTETTASADTEITIPADTDKPTSESDVTDLERETDTEETTGTDYENE